MKKITTEYPEENFVLEGWHVYPKEISKLFRGTDVKIICLGYTKISCEEAFKLIRENEKENSYTRRLTDEKVKRINELYKKSKAEGLTDAERKEQKILRQEYMELVRRNLRGQLNNIDIEQKDGTVINLGEKYGAKFEKKGN